MEDNSVLLHALWADTPRAKYVTGGEIDVGTYPMPTSIHVEGAGTLALPLCNEDLLKLKGVSTDEQLPVAWQVDASKVSCPEIPDFFSKVVVDLSFGALTELGIDADALGLEVRLYKLLVYEQGGHYNLHTDVEKEAGMLATMILQLPTQSGYEGGQLEIHYEKTRETFDLSGAKSTAGYFQTVFFCDCKHELEEVKSGSRLCLEFNLVRKNANLVDVGADGLPNYISALGQVQRLLKEWTDEVCLPPPLLAIPLGYKYSMNGLSFAGLKGYDRVVCALVLSCASFLDIHLCMLVKEVTSAAYEEIDGKIQIRYWTTLEDKQSSYLSSCDFDLDYVVRMDYINDPFNDKDKPDEEENEPGKHGTCITNSTYGAAVLVVWPKRRRMEALCYVQTVTSVVRMLEEQHKQEPEKTSEDLQSYLDGLLEKEDCNKYDGETYYLLEFCLKHDFRDAAFKLLEEWSLKFLTAKAFGVIISAIQKYGWDECYKAGIQDALGNEDLKGEALYFPTVLEESGLQDVAVWVAKELLKRNDFLDTKFYCLEDFVEFLFRCGLEDEAWHILDSTLERHWFTCTSVMAVALQKWGDAYIPRVEEFLKKRIGERKVPPHRTETSCYSRYAPYGFDIFLSPAEKKRREEEEKEEARKDLLREIAKLVLALEVRGCHSAALVFTNKYFSDDAKNLCREDALVLLLCGGLDMFHRAVRDRREILGNMRALAGLIGLKKDDKVTRLFTDILAGWVKEDKPTIDLELLDNVFWLGNEELVTTIVTKVKRNSSLVDAIFRIDEVNVPGIETLLAKSREWSDVGKTGWMDVVSARYLCCNKKRKMSDEEDEEEDEESDPKTKRIRWEKLLVAREKERPIVEQMLKTEA